jgi:hypothetical protein
LKGDGLQLPQFLQRLGLLTRRRFQASNQFTVVACYEGHEVLFHRPARCPQEEQLKQKERLLSRVQFQVQVQLYLTQAQPKWMAALTHSRDDANLWLPHPHLLEICAF